MQGFSKIMPVVPVQINGGYGSMLSNAVPLTVTAPVNANANLFEARSSGGTLLSGIDKNGNVFAPNISSNNITGTTVSNYCGNVITNLFSTGAYGSDLHVGGSIFDTGPLWLYGGTLIRSGGAINLYNSDNSKSVTAGMSGSDLIVDGDGTRVVFRNPVLASTLNDNLTNSVPLTAQGAATQVANLIEARKGSTLVAAVDANGNFSTAGGISGNTVTATNGVATYATNSYPFTATGWTNTSGVNTRVIITGATTAVFYGTNNVAMFTVGAIAATPFPWEMHPLESLVGTGISGTAWIQ
jgi:hypothetical protein